MVDVIAAAMDPAALAALGEPNRLRIVELLRSGPRAVGEIAEALGLRQPQASKHLRVLGEAGFVDVEPERQRRIYRLRAEQFGAIGGWVESFEQLWETRLDGLGVFLHALTDEGNDDGERAGR